MSTTLSSPSNPSSTSGSRSNTSSAAPAISPRPQRLDQSPLVDDRAAGGVDEDRGTRHRAERVRVDEVSCLRGERHVEAHDVGLGEERVEVVDTAGEDRAGAECLGQRRRLAADPAGPDHEQPLPVEARAEHELEREHPFLPPADEAVALRDPPQQREHQANRELRRRPCKHVRRVCDDDVPLRRSGEVDVVHPDGVVRHDAELRAGPVEIGAVDSRREHRDDPVHPVRRVARLEVPPERLVDLGGDGRRDVDPRTRHRPAAYPSSVRARWAAE